MAKEIQRIVIQNGSQEWEFAAGGGKPAENSVGSAEIEDKGIMEQDLHDDVAAGLHELDNEANYAQHADIDEIFSGAQQSDSGSSQSGSADEEGSDFNFD